MRLNTFNEWTPDQPSRGLGDTVAKFTHKTGIAQAVHKHFPDCRCPERQTFLNKVVPYKKRTMKTLSIIAALIALTVQTQAAQLRFSFANLTNNSSAVMIRLTPQSPPWITGGITLGDPVTFAATNSPVILSNVYGATSTNEANYYVEMTGRTVTSFYIHVPLTNEIMDVQGLVIPNPRGFGIVGIPLAVGDARYTFKADSTNIANQAANTSSNAANAYTLTIGWYGTNYALSIGANGTNYAQGVFQAGSNYANQVTNGAFFSPYLSTLKNQTDQFTNTFFDCGISMQTNTVLQIPRVNNQGNEPYWLANNLVRNVLFFDYDSDELKYTKANGTMGQIIDADTLNLGLAPLQYGSAVLSNGVATGFLTNAAAFQPASQTLSNIAGTGAVTNGATLLNASTNYTDTKLNTASNMLNNAKFSYGEQYFTPNMIDTTLIGNVGGNGWGARAAVFTTGSARSGYFNIHPTNLICGSNITFNLLVLTTNNAVSGAVRVRYYLTTLTNLEQGPSGALTSIQGWTNDARWVAPAGTNLWWLTLTGTYNTTGFNPTNAAMSIGYYDGGPATNYWIMGAKIRIGNGNPP